MVALRRVVTGVGPTGQAGILADEEIVADPRPGQAIVMQPLWRTSNEPPVPGVDVPPLPTSPFPRPGEVVFNVTTFPPGSTGDGAGWGPMHETDSVDFVVVLEGEICLRLDGGEELALGAGTCLVQTGTVHAWSNRSATTARVAAVMLSARRRDGQRSTGDNRPSGTAGASPGAEEGDGDSPPTSLPSR